MLIIKSPIGNIARLRNIDRKRNTIDIKNKRTISSDYKPIKSTTKHYQKSSYDDQTDNKQNLRDIDMSMGLGKEKKPKARTKDQNEEKQSSLKEAMTSSQLAPPESIKSSNDSSQI